MFNFFLGGMDEFIIIDLSIREEVEEEIDFEKGAVVLGWIFGRLGFEEDGFRFVIGLLLVFLCF